MQRGFSRRQKDVSRLVRERRDQEKARLEWERKKFGSAGFKRIKK
jgi:hypothetical protein